MSDSLLNNIIRDYLGKIVRETWVAYCEETGVTQPSHLVPWENLSEWDKEADRRIGEAVAVMMSGRQLPLTFSAAAVYDHIRREERQRAKVRREEWPAQRLDDAARETEEP